MRELSIITKSDEEKEETGKGLNILLQSGTFLKYTDTMAKYIKEEYSASCSTPVSTLHEDYDEDLDRQSELSEIAESERTIGSHSPSKHSSPTPKRRKLKVKQTLKFIKEGPDFFNLKPNEENTSTTAVSKVKSNTSKFPKPTLMRRQSERVVTIKPLIKENEKPLDFTDR